MFRDLKLWLSRTKNLPPKWASKWKCPASESIWGYKWIWSLLKVQKEVHFWGKKVRFFFFKESSQGLRSIRHEQPLEEETGEESKRGRVIWESFLSGSQGNHRWVGKPHLHHSFQLLPHQTISAVFLMGENDWFQSHSFFHKDSHVVEEPWTWVRNLRAESCCDYMSEPSCVTLRCPNIWGSRFPHLKSPGAWVLMM